MEHIFFCFTDLLEYAATQLYIAEQGEGENMLALIQLGVK
jgi:hypothetical protein